MDIQTVKYILLGIQLIMLAIQTVCFIASMKCNKRIRKHYQELFAKSEDLTSKDN